MHTVTRHEVEAWLTRADNLAELTRSFGPQGERDGRADHLPATPFHLRVTIEQLARERDEVAATVFDSIPFYSLCRGLFLPLSALTSERAANLFGIAIEPPPDSSQREVLLERFMAREVGLSLSQKVTCLLGDPFRGRPSSFQRDSMLRLLLSVDLISRRTLLDRLAQVGDVAILFAMNRRETRVDPPLTAAEVLETLRYLPRAKANRKLEILRSLLTRCGRLEAYFLAKLLLRKAGFGFEYQGQLLAKLIAGRFGVEPDAIAHAMALTDAFRVTELLVAEGPPALRKIQLQPLVAVHPALAAGVTDDLKSYPVWVERKYDGIRLMLHKSTDARGGVLTGAYTRNRGDWLELVPGLAATIKLFPAHSAIVDGELYGTVIDGQGARPATVYEVYSALQGQPIRPVSLRFAAFDLIYLNGADLTQRPLHQRRNQLTNLVSPLANLPLPVPVTMSEGQMAGGKDDVSRLYQHFRAQGYEGIIAKDPNGLYQLAARDPTWMKRKPMLTLDLVLLGAVMAVTSKTNVGLFGSYVIGARSPEGGFEEVGDVAGVDRVRDAELQGEIMREGLLTGRRIERPSASGARPGLELRPSIVVTIKLEGVLKDPVTGKTSLRDPKLVVIRSDKSAFEADSTKAIEELYLKSRIG